MRGYKRGHTVHEDESVDGMIRFFAVKIIKIDLTEKANFTKAGDRRLSILPFIDKMFTASRCYAA